MTLSKAHPAVLTSDVSKLLACDKSRLAILPLDRDSELLGNLSTYVGAGFVVHGSTSLVRVCYSPSQAVHDGANVENGSLGVLRQNILVSSEVPLKVIHSQVNIGHAKHDEMISQATRGGTGRLLECSDAYRR